MRRSTFGASPGSATVVLQSREKPLQTASKTLAEVVNRAALLLPRRLVCHVSKVNRTIGWTGQSEIEGKAVDKKEGMVLLMD